MISEIVLFSLPEGLSREEAMAEYRARVPVWQSNPDLIHKAFLYDETSRRGGGVYLWKNTRGEIGARPGLSRGNPVHLRL